MGNASPLARLSVTDRYRVLDLKLMPSQVVPDGKLMWLRGRKIIGYGTTDKIATVPREADGVMLSIADHRLITGEA